ncbi:fucolectin-like [Ambystoma mexicanum]|uniref:fucolectin-like n=1 Tax=Ambystoma mexicanum TaxID=8296 RepID=UPI0037E96281
MGKPTFNVPRASVDGSCDYCSLEVLREIMKCQGIMPPAVKLGENVALSGRATQSSILRGDEGSLSDAINAIDGNQDPNFVHGSCSCTNSEYAPWWRVDLLKPYRINAIIITNRNSVPERLNGAEILIGNSLANQGNNNPRCAYISSMAAGATQTFYCALVGRYVNIAIRGRQEFLTLCEVQVFGQPV